MGFKTCPKRAVKIGKKNSAPHLGGEGITFKAARLLKFKTNLSFFRGLIPLVVERDIYLPLFKDPPDPTGPPFCRLINRAVLTAALSWISILCRRWRHTSLPFWANIAPLARKSKVAIVQLRRIISLTRPEHRFAIHGHAHVFQPEGRSKPVWTDLEFEF